MLTLLRKIRKSLIESLPARENTVKQAGGSVQKYLLYAIGEIALVVIGILIALQINNWNEKNKALKNEKELLIEVYDALETDSTSIVSGKTLLDNMFNLHQQLYQIHIGELPSDSLKNLNTLRRVSLISPVVDVNYPNLASEVINKEVKLKVLNYYQNVDRWRKYINEFNNFIRNKMRPFLGEYQLQNYGVQFSDDTNSIDSERLLQILDVPEVQQMFFEATQRSRGPFNQTMKSHRELTEIIAEAIK